LPERRCCTSAERQRKMVDQSLHARRSSCRGTGQTRFEPLGKDRTPATAGAAPKSPDLHYKTHVNVNAMRRQISEVTAITAVNPSGS